MLKLLLALAALTASPAHAGTQPLLRLYFLPTYPVRLDWSAPRNLIESAINGLIRNRTAPIGHVNEEIDCGDGTPATLLGAVGAGAGPISNLLMVEQVGFSLLERGWVGSTEERAHILDTFRARGRDPKQMSVVTYAISPSTCQRLLAYAHAYETETRPIYYGFAPRPRHREGSGCSAFGASFAEVAGFLDPDLYAAWTTRRLVPLSLVAGHGKDKVPIAELRGSPASQRWATESEPRMDLTFFDPDAMYEWAVRLAANPEELARAGGTLEGPLPYGIQGVASIRFDRTNVPTPAEDFFLGGPSLAPKGQNSVVRTDVRFEPDGSFVIVP